jgi:hypothetical protein
MQSYAVRKSPRFIKQGADRFQPLGGPHDAVADARLVLERPRQMEATVPRRSLLINRVGPGAAFIRQGRTRTGDAGLNVSDSGGRFMNVRL